LEAIDTLELVLPAMPGKIATVTLDWERLRAEQAYLEGYFARGTKRFRAAE